MFGYKGDCAEGHKTTGGQEKRVSRNDHFSSKPPLFGKISIFLLKTPPGSSGTRTKCTKCIPLRAREATFSSIYHQFMTKKPPFLGFTGLSPNPSFPGFKAKRPVVSAVNSRKPNNSGKIHSDTEIHPSSRRKSEFPSRTVFT